MNEDDQKTAVKKESPVLTETSLSFLSREIVDTWLVLSMWLNIPTVRLVHMQLDGEEKELSQEKIIHNVLMYWKGMREGAKEKEKVVDLMKALKEVDKQDWADVLEERHKDSLELTADCFA